MSLKSFSKRLTSNAQVIYTTPFDKEASAHSVAFSNISSSTSTFSLRHYHAATRVLHVLAINYTVEAHTLYQWPAPINLQAGDYLEAYSSDNNVITCQLAIYENSNATEGFNVTGLWSSTTDYKTNDIVQYQLTSYVAIQPSTGVIPGAVGSQSSWQIFGTGVPEQQLVYIEESPPIDPVHGRLWWNSATGKLEIYYQDGTSSQWVDASPVSAAPPTLPYDLVTWYAGRPVAGHILLKVVMARAVYYQADFAGSTVALAEREPSNIATCYIYKNDDIIGQIVYSPGSSVGVINSVGGQPYGFAAGDVLKIVAPSPRDITLEGISIILVGMRTG